jgi:hypothetical protein
MIRAFLGRRRNVTFGAGHVIGRLIDSYADEA